MAGGQVDPIRLRVMLIEQESPCKEMSFTEKSGVGRFLSDRSGLYVVGK